MKDKKGSENFRNNHKTSNKMALLIDLSIITLNVNGLNTAIKRHTVTIWIKKQDPSCLKETHVRPKDTCKWNARGWRIIYHANGCQKKVRIATLILDKIDFKTKTVRQRRTHYIIIKGTIQQKTLTIVNMHPQRSTQIHNTVDNKRKGTN